MPMQFEIASGVSGNCHLLDNCPRCWISLLSSWLLGFRLALPGAGPRATACGGEIPAGARRDKNPGDLVSQGIGKRCSVAGPFFTRGIGHEPTHRFLPLHHSCIGNAAFRTVIRWLVVFPFHRNSPAFAQSCGTHSSARAARSDQFGRDRYDLDWLEEGEMRPE
jgi:hypothetical protein